MSLRIHLRPVADADSPFLYDLYKESRAAEFAPLNLLEAQLEALMTSQYRVREQSYRSQFPDAEHSIVFADDTCVGQLRVYRTEKEHRLVDIALARQHRGQGIGTRVVENLIAAAKSARVPLTSTVAVNNHGSLRFHQRLGFTVIGEDPMYLQLEYPAS